MRCYSWENGVIEEGMVVEIRGKTCVIPLGATPDTREIRYVPIHVYNPPQITKGRIYKAYPVLKKVQEPDPNAFFVLARPHPQHADDKRVLVRVSTYAGVGATPNMGGWVCSEGNVELIKEGIRHEPGGDLYRVGVVRLCPGAALRVITGCKPGAAHTISLQDGELYTQHLPTDSGDTHVRT